METFKTLGMEIVDFLGNVVFRARITKFVLFT
jgi:hypothetical protein